MRHTMITGATSGLGEAIVARLGNTDSIIGIGRDPKALERISMTAGVAEAIACDLSDSAACLALFDDRAVDVLVNNAGVLPSREEFSDLPVSAINEMIDVNFRAVVLLTQAALEGMRERGSGHLVFIGSSAGRFPHAGATVYGATKAAISLFADALRSELLGERIRVTEIAPGRMRSNLYRDAVGSTASAELYDEYEPLEPKDVADAVAYALDAPAHVDVSRIEIFPTAQAVGGARIVKTSEMGLKASKT